MSNGPTMTTHFVVKIEIEQVTHVFPTPDRRNDPQIQKGERTVDDVVRIVTKADNIGTAIVKAKRYLDVEREDIPLDGEQADRLAADETNFPVVDPNFPE